VRVIVGRVALLLGVAIVAAMAWYGATALFDMGTSDDPDSPGQRSCEAATKGQADDARRAFLQEHKKARWLSGVGTTRTRILDELPNGEPVPPVEGDGWVLLVTHRADRESPDLPTCLNRVPVVTIQAGPFRGD
jgi:hypothetical protein